MCLGVRKRVASVCGVAWGWYAHVKRLCGVGTDFYTCRSGSITSVVQEFCVAMVSAREFFVARESFAWS